MTISIKTVLSSAAPLLLVAGVALSTPAAALTFSEAAKVCAKNPGCSSGPRDKTGGHTLVIKQSDGTTSVVHCPGSGGACFIVSAKGSPGGGKLGAGAARNVMGVLVRDQHL